MNSIPILATTVLCTASILSADCYKISIFPGATQLCVCEANTPCIEGMYYTYNAWAYCDTGGSHKICTTKEMVVGTSGNCTAAFNSIRYLADMAFHGSNFDSYYQSNRCRYITCIAGPAENITADVVDEIKDQCGG